MGEGVGSSQSLLAPKMCLNVPKIGTFKFITPTISYSMSINIFIYWGTQIYSQNLHAVKHIEDLANKVF